MIVDTMALSDFLKEEPGIKRNVAGSTSFNIPVMVLGEYRFGLRLSKYRQILEAKLEELLKDVQILPVEEQTTGMYADIRSELKAAGTPIPENDLWIAALVREYDLPLLSKDRHFDNVQGISRLSWRTLRITRGCSPGAAVDKCRGNHNTAPRNHPMIDTKRVPHLVLCSALGAAFLVLSLYRGIVATSSFHQPWSGYYTVLVDEAAPIAEVVDRLGERFPDRVVSSVTSMVSFSVFGRTSSIDIAEIDARFDDLDPRLDDYMRRVGALFRVNRGDEGLHVVYVRSTRNVLVFAATVSGALRGSGYRWNVAELAVLGNLVLLGLGLVFLGVLYLRIRSHRLAHLLGALPWLVNCFSGQMTDLLVFYLVFPFWCGFFAEAVAYTANTIYFRWRDPDGRDMRNRLASVVIVTAAACVLTLMLGGNGRETARTLASLGADLLLVALWVTRYGLRSHRSRHRVFQPVPIGRRLRRLEDSPGGRRELSLRCCLTVVRRLFVVQRIPVAILVIMAAASPLVSYLDRLYSDAPVPVPEPLEGEAALSWEGLERLWRLSRDADLPNLSHFLTHQAYQESLRYARGWEFPQPNEQVIIPEYESAESGRVREVPRVVYEFTPEWLSKVLSEAGDGSVEGLLLNQNRPVQVILSGGDVRAGREIRAWKIVIFALVVILSLALWELYLTPPDLYGTNGLPARRRQHPA